MGFSTHVIISVLRQSTQLSHADDVRIKTVALHLRCVYVRRRNAKLADEDFISHICVDRQNTEDCENIPWSVFAKCPFDN